MTIRRDKGGRFAGGGSSPNPKGRPKKEDSVDAALKRALNEKITVTEDGKRKRKSKLDVAATQVANKSAGGDMRAVQLAFNEKRKGEQNDEAARARTPAMTQSDREIAARVIARLKQFIIEGSDDNAPEA